jgi:hypothetical protein
MGDKGQEPSKSCAATHVRDVECGWADARDSNWSIVNQIVRTNLYCIRVPGTCTCCTQDTVDNIKWSETTTDVTSRRCTTVPGTSTWNFFLFERTGGGVHRTSVILQYCRMQILYYTCTVRHFQCIQQNQVSSRSFYMPLIPGRGAWPDLPDEVPEVLATWGFGTLTHVSVYSTQIY